VGGGVGQKAAPTGENEVRAVAIATDFFIRRNSSTIFHG
jgi:hypothetical protein